MDTSRANLDQLQSNKRYLSLSAVFVILSLIGIFLFFKIKSTQDNIVTPPEPPLVFEENPQSATPSPEFVPSVSETPSEFPATSSPLPSPEDSPAPTLTPGPTPAFQTYDGTEDGFTLSYMSDRKVYKIAEPTGHRIAFYRIGGNIAVHVGSDWSWENPGRPVLDNTRSYLLSGQPAFRYDISAQTLVDVKYKDKFYTIQCIHNSDAALKSECEKLITSFKFL
ncbi:MAG: hypothetical protein WC841_05380 [Candidatus Shapirobacteria bacterium]|jgi:hypothetical protein